MLIMLAYMQIRRKIGTHVVNTLQLFKDTFKLLPKLYTDPIITAVSPTMATKELWRPEGRGSHPFICWMKKKVTKIHRIRYR